MVGNAFQIIFVKNHAVCTFLYCLYEQCYQSKGTRPENVQENPDGKMSTQRIIKMHTDRV